MFNLFLVAVIGMGVFVFLPACSNRITIIVYSQLAMDGDQEGFFGALLEQQFGVRMRVVGDPDGSRFAARARSGDLGDIVVFDNNGVQYQEAVAQGLLFDWNRDNLLQNFGSNIYEFFYEALEASQEITDSIEGMPAGLIGGVYGIGHSITPTAWSSGRESFFYNWDIRWDIFQQTNFYKYPEQYPLNTMDDYLQLMIAMNAAQPYDFLGNSTYAVSMWRDWDDTMVMYVKSKASAFYGFDEFGIGLVEVDARPEYAAFVYHDALMAGNPRNPATFGPYLSMLYWFFRLNQAGLVDPGSFTQTFDGMISQVRNGAVFTSLFDFSGNMQFNSDENLEEGKMMVSLAPNNARTISYASNPFGGERMWAIGSRTRHPELAMKIIDFFFSPEGSMTRLYGLRGVHWDYNEDNSISFTEFGRASFRDQDMRQEGQAWTAPNGQRVSLRGRFRDGIPLINNSGWAMDAFNPDAREGYTFNWQTWQSERQPSDILVEQSWQRFVGAYSRQEYLANGDFSIIPAANFSPSRLGALAVSHNQITDEIKTYSWRAIAAADETVFFNIIESLINSANTRGYMQLINFYRSELERKFGRTLEPRDITLARLNAV